MAARLPARTCGDNGCTITHKDLRWHMNIIETEGEQSDEDPAAASKAEK